MALNRARVNRPIVALADVIRALQQFFEEHELGVFSLLVHLGMDEGQAADLTQQVFVRVWKTERQSQNEDERVVACYRYALGWGRSAVAGRRTPRTLPADNQVVRALEDLPEEERIAIVLCRIAKLRPELVAQVLVDSEWRVLKLLSRATARLAAVLTPPSGGEV